MNKNIARFIAGPLAAAGLGAGALGFAAAANADDPVKAAPDLFSAHSGVIFAHATFISEPDRVTNPGTNQHKHHFEAAAENHHAR
jgi:hypothetical protein